MPQDIQSTLKDPKFLALGPDDQVAVLKKLREGAPTKPAAKSAIASPPTPPQSPVSQQVSTLGKLGRGAALGAAHGAGIEPENATEASSGKQVALGAVKHATQGIGNAMGEIAMDPIKGSFHLANNIVENTWASGRESWQGMKDSDPEQFAHGFASAVTQIALLRGFFKDAGEIAGEKPPLTKATAKISAATKPGAEDAAAIERSMPDVVKTAKGSGIKTVGELGDAVHAAHAAKIAEFNDGMRFIAGKQVPTDPIYNRLMREIDLEDLKTAKGRAKMQEIHDYADTYSDKSMSVAKLNRERMDLRAAEHAYYNKESGAQASAVRSDLELKLNKIAADEAERIVYDEWQRANPGKNVAALKQAHSALWAFDDFLNGPGGKIAQLHAEQLEHEGLGPAGRFKVHAYASPSSGGLFRAHVSGLSEALSEGPEKVASKRVASGFKTSAKRTATRTAAASLPIDNLLRTPKSATPKRRSSVPPPPEPPQ